MNVFLTSFLAQLHTGFAATVETPMASITAGSRSHECHFCETTISPLKSSPKYAPKNLGAIPDIFPKTLGNSTYWTYIVMGKNMLGIEESAVSMAAAKVAKP